MSDTMSDIAVGDKVLYTGGGRFSGNQVFTGLCELRVGDVGIVHCIPGEKAELGCTFDKLRVSLNCCDVRPFSFLKPSAKTSPKPPRPPFGKVSAACQRLSAFSPASTRASSKASSSSDSHMYPQQSSSRRNSCSPNGFRRPAIAGQPLEGTMAGSIGRYGRQHIAAVLGATEKLCADAMEDGELPVADSERLAEPDAQGDEKKSSSDRPHPPSFYCPISHQCMHDPVVLTDGHTYERRHIEHWLQRHNTSPVSGAKLPHLMVVPNHALRNAIEEYFEQVLGDHREAIKKAISGHVRAVSSRNTTLVNTINSLMQCSILVNADLSIEHVLTKIMQEARFLIGADVASVFLVDRKKNELYSTVNSTGGELRIPIKSGVAGSVAYSGIPLIIQHAYSDGRFNAEVDSKTGFKTRNIMCVPIKAWKGAIIGVVELINKASNGIVVSAGGNDDKNQSDSDELDFTPDDQQFLEVLAAQAGSAIINSGIFESMPGVRGAGRWPSPSRVIRFGQHTYTSEAPRRSSSHSRNSSHCVDKETSLSCSPTADTTQNVPMKEEEEPPFARLFGATSKEEEAGLSAKQLQLLGPLLVAAADGWEADTLSLAELSNNKPLSTLGMHLFEHHGLPSAFDIDSKKLENFLLEIERGYPVSNHYHNRAHAASVTHFMHCLLSHGGVAEATSHAAGMVEDGARQQEIVKLSGLLAAVVHDYQHKGLNNDYLVKTSNVRAIAYNDKSPNENHHVAAAWLVLQQPDCNFLENLTAVESQQVHKLVVKLVLATDMAKHSKGLKKLQRVVGSVILSNKLEAISAESFTEQDALVGLQTALKCADLGHLALPWSSHMRWVRRLEEEFFAQGDQERKEGMSEVSFLMDRNKQGAADTQVGFFDSVVFPLFREFTKAFPRAHPMLSAVEGNYHHWKSISAELEARA